MSPRTGTARTFPEHLASVVELLEALAGTQPAPASRTTPSVQASLYRLEDLMPAPAPTTAPPAAPPARRQARTHPALGRAGRAAHRRAGKAGRAAA